MDQAKDPAGNHLSILMAFFGCINDGQARALAPLLADGVTLSYPGLRPIEGRRAVILFFRQLLARYEYLEFSVQHIIRDGAHACVRWCNRGTPVSGGSFRNAGVTVIEIAEERIVYIDDYFKEPGTEARSDDGTR